MTWAQPDEVADHYPAGACGCGADLAGAVDLGVARSFQQLEIPPPSFKDYGLARQRTLREHAHLPHSSGRVKNRPGRT